jgi:hypothetical protein
MGQVRDVKSLTLHREAISRNLVMHHFVYGQEITMSQLAEAELVSKQDREVSSSISNLQRIYCRHL